MHLQKHLRLAKLKVLADFGTLESYVSSAVLVFTNFEISAREDVLLATAAINYLAGKSGFAPIQWVLGRKARLPADIMDEGEVARLGAQAAAETPTIRFFRKNQLRMAAHEAFVKTATHFAGQNSEG
eukprot:s2397_g18.t1